MKPDKPIKARDIELFVRHLRTYARQRKLGKPDVILNHNAADRAPFRPWGFMLQWGEHKRAWNVGGNWSPDDFDRLIKRLRRW
ncbi:MULTISPECIES: hypothetical protein [unclassified Bradyrhizobium]|uniref:hypothetical protein n=1 Tax=unclassified Bradyrhizobium TaxID=2631580 RepID=UPI002FF06837